MKKINSKLLTEAALKQLVTWWEGLSQAEKEKIANSSNRPQMAKFPIDKWQERDLQALIVYAGKNNVLFEIATVLRLEKMNLKEDKTIYATVPIKCPTCNAASGEVCTDKGKPVEMHRARSSAFSQDKNNKISGRYRLPKSFGIKEGKGIAMKYIDQ